MKSAAPERPPHNPMQSPSIELLAPARDLACGIAAVNCGADAVYIGAERFGAREQAANSVDDIAALVRHAHPYWVRVYAAVNTILRDDEIPQAVRLIERLYEAGVDGLILQDVGLLECDLPPLPLIASTQMHNHTPERVAFLEKVGFQRAILARELSLEQIRAIRAAAPAIELECFVHGALCVSYSGQCYLSYALGQMAGGAGRSGNRGCCAQPCRKFYTLRDARGEVLAKGHLLSLRDLCLADHLEELIAAGVTAFKIEGRRKDAAYTANTVAFYRQRLDEILSRKGLRKSSSGTCHLDFVPDLNKTFHRGYTTHFLYGRRERIGSPATPKMVGETVGKVKSIQRREVVVETTLALHSGDGLCFFDRASELRGSVVNAVRGNTIVLEKTDGLRAGMVLYRNRDHVFLSRLERSRAERRIAVSLTLLQTAEGLLLRAEDEDANRAEFALATALEPADKPEQALAAIRRQLEKMGGSIFSCRSLQIEIARVCFVPVSRLNALRRGVLENLAAAREAARPVCRRPFVRSTVPYPEKTLSYLGNVLNRHAEAFYRRHGVEHIEPAAESGLDLRGRRVMVSRYCLLYELGHCDGAKKHVPPTEPLALVDAEGRRLQLAFRCDRCEMEVVLPRSK